MGELLISRGVLTEAQVQEILDTQKKTGRPFGDLAERLFNISSETVEQAWIDQYLSYGTEIDLDRQRIDVRVLKMINRRQAWQFRVAPLRQDEQDLVAATTREHLRRAVNFAWRRFHQPVYFLVAQRPQLEQFLMKHYPWPNALQLPMAG